MKRSGAVLAAAAMIGVSLWVRARIDDNDAASRPAVACVEELAVACEAALGGTVDLRVEPAAVTAAALIDGEADIDHWVTLDGWPQLVAAAGNRPTPTPHPLAASRLVLAVELDRADVLGQQCAEVDWRCVLDRVGRPWGEIGGDESWGPVKVGRPGTATGVGLLVDASAIAAVAGTTDLGTNDDGFRQARAAAAGLGEGLFSDFAARLPALFAGFATTQAQVTTDSGRIAGRVAIVTPAPGAVAVAVLDSPGGADGVDRDRLQEAVRDQGFDEPVPASAGSLSGGVLLALSGL